MSYRKRYQFFTLLFPYFKQNPETATVNTAFVILIDRNRHTKKKQETYVAYCNSLTRKQVANTNGTKNKRNAARVYNKMQTFRERNAEIERN